MKILLLADLCKDVFLMCDTPRMSPEKPVVIATLQSVKENLGMGGNVLANLQSLAPHAEIGTLFPDQPSVKTRYVDRGSNQHLLRVDQDVKCPPMDAQTFIEILSKHDWDAVIASDYGKGFLSPDILENVAFLCRQKKVPLFMDTKAVLGSWSAGVFCVKINAKEFVMLNLISLSNSVILGAGLVPSISSGGMR